MCARARVCVLCFVTDIFSVQICTEHVEIDKADLSRHLLMAGSSPSSSSEVAVRGIAAAKCLLALALCHSTVRDPTDSESPSSSSAAAAASADGDDDRPGMLSCCRPSRSAKDDVSMADEASGAWLLCSCFGCIECLGDVFVVIYQQMLATQLQ